MCGAVEVLGAQDGKDALDGLSREEHRAENGLLRLEVVGRYPVGRGHRTDATNDGRFAQRETLLEDVFRLTKPGAARALAASPTWSYSLGLTSPTSPPGPLSTALATRPPAASRLVPTFHRFAPNWRVKERRRRDVRRRPGCRVMARLTSHPGGDANRRRVTRRPRRRRRLRRLHQTRPRRELRRRQPHRSRR